MLIELKIRLSLEDSVSQLDVERSKEILLFLMAACGSKLTTHIRCRCPFNKYLEDFLNRNGFDKKSRE